MSAGRLNDPVVTIRFEARKPLENPAGPPDFYFD